MKTSKIRCWALVLLVGCGFDGETEDRAGTLMLHLEPTSGGLEVTSAQLIVGAHFPERPLVTEDQARTYLDTHDTSSAVFEQVIDGTVVARATASLTSDFHGPDAGALSETWVAFDHQSGASYRIVSRDQAREIDPALVNGAEIVDSTHSSAEHVELLMNDGPVSGDGLRAGEPDGYVDIVFMSDPGWTLQEFNDHAAAQRTRLLFTSPYSDFGPRIRTWLIHNHDPLGCTKSSWLNAQLQCDPVAVISNVGTVPFDYVVVFVKGVEADSNYFYERMVAIRHDDDQASIVAHELGHAIGGLANEATDAVEEAANCTADTKCAKWEGFPAMECRPGCGGNRRPGEDCIMHSPDDPMYCSVCRHVLGKALARYATGDYIYQQSPEQRMHLVAAGRIHTRAWLWAPSTGMALSNGGWGPWEDVTSNLTNVATAPDPLTGFSSFVHPDGGLVQQFAKGGQLWARRKPQVGDWEGWTCYDPLYGGAVCNGTRVGTYTGFSASALYGVIYQHVVDDGQVYERTKFPGQAWPSFVPSNSFFERLPAMTGIDTSMYLGDGQTQYLVYDGKILERNRSIASEPFLPIWTNRTESLGIEGLGKPTDFSVFEKSVWLRL